MNLRIEFPPSRSPSFEHTMGICRRLPGFKETTQSGAPLYTIEFKDTEFESAQAVIDLIRNLRMVTFYIEGLLVSRTRALYEVSERVFNKYKEDFAERQRRREIERRLSMQKLIRDAKTPGDISGNIGPTT